MPWPMDPHSLEPVTYALLSTLSKEGLALDELLNAVAVLIDEEARGREFPSPALTRVVALLDEAIDTLNTAIPQSLRDKILT